MLEWWDYNRTAIEQDPDVLATVQTARTDGYGNPLRLDDIVGRLATDTMGRPVGGTAFAVYFSLENNISKGQDDLINSHETCAWETAIGDRFVDTEVGSLSVYVFNNCYFNHVMMSTAFGDVYLVGLSKLS